MELGILIYLKKYLSNLKRYIGSIIASGVASIVYGYTDEDGMWRYLFLAGALVSIPLLFLRSKIPESPRWLLNKSNNFVILFFYFLKVFNKLNGN